jgi:membrane protein YdbS with pleckstrin-like domain
MPTDDRVKISRPGLDWGPFSIGIVCTLVIYAAAAGLVYFTVRYSLWWLIGVVVLALCGTMCLASAIGVLHAQRRVWNSEQRQAYIATHGTLSDEKELDEPMELK